MRIASGVLIASTAAAVVECAPATASGHPGHRGRGFGTLFRDPDTSDPPGAPEHLKQTFTSATVTFPPGARAVPHRHGNAFVYAYVLEGAVRSQLEGEPMRTCHIRVINAATGELLRQLTP